MKIIVEKIEEVGEAKTTTRISADVEKDCTFDLGSAVDALNGSIKTAVENFEIIIPEHTKPETPVLTPEKFDDERIIHLVANNIKEKGLIHQVIQGVM